MSQRFILKTTTEAVRPSYKELEDVRKLGIKKYLTISQLRKEFLLTHLQIAQMLREKQVWPVGKVYKINPNTGKNANGKPELAYDPEESKAAIKEVLEEKILRESAG